MALSKLQRSAVDAAIADLADCEISTPDWIRTIARVRRGGDSEYFDVAHPLLAALGYAQVCVSWGLSPARWGASAGEWLREYALYYVAAAEWAMRFPAGLIGGLDHELSAIRVAIEQESVRIDPSPPAPGRACLGPCLLCRPELVPAMFGGTKP